ncbi:MAG: nuclear transport factor 2 family protein [Gemmatimonadaceae bacterium]
MIRLRLPNVKLDHDTCYQYCGDAASLPSTYTMDDTHIREMLAVVDERDWTSLRRYFHDAVVYLRPGYAPLQGVDAVMHFYEFERVIASGTHVVNVVLVDGTHVASFGRLIGTHRNGSALDEEFAEHYEFREGKVWRRKSYFFRAAI